LSHSQWCLGESAVRKSPKGFNGPMYIWVIFSNLSLATNVDEVKVGGNEQTIKIEEQDVKVSEQDVKVEEQTIKFEEQDVKVGSNEQTVKVEEQDVKVGSNEQTVKVEEQDVKVGSEQVNIGITSGEENVKVSSGEQNVAGSSEEDYALNGSLALGRNWGIPDMEVYMRGSGTRISDGGLGGLGIAIMLLIWTLIV